MSAIPASLRVITPYVRRASEVEKTGDDRAYVIAYYCRTHALELAFKLDHSSAEVQSFLTEMLDTLEGMKAEHPELNDKDECEDVVRTYAQEKLMEAESEYMDCQANKNTARRYYAAASFLEVLATFHPEKTLDEATKKSSLFAKWRATEILKAIKEGRPPIPSDEELAKSRGLDLNDDDDDDGDDGAGADGADDDLDYLPPPAPTATPTYRSNRRDETSEEEEEEERPRLRPTRTSSSSRSNKPSRSGASGGSSRNRVPKYSSNLPETAR